jgi:hypothetical protein
MLNSILLYRHGQSVHHLLVLYLQRSEADSLLVYKSIGVVVY